MGTTEYETLGDPDADYDGPTPAQTRRQEEADRIRDAVKRFHTHPVTGGEGAGRHLSHCHDDDEVGHVHEEKSWGPSYAGLPPPSQEQLDQVDALLTSLRTEKRSGMTWRLRLYCGHVVERPAHTFYATVSAAFLMSVRCTTCGMEATIIAARPLPQPERQAPAPEPASTKKLRRQVAEAEAALARARKALDADLARGSDAT